MWTALHLLAAEAVKQPAIRIALDIVVSGRDRRKGDLDLTPLFECPTQTSLDCPSFMLR